MVRGSLGGVAFIVEDRDEHRKSSLDVLELTSLGRPFADLSRCDVISSRAFKPQKKVGVKVRTGAAEDYGWRSKESHKLLDEAQIGQRSAGKERSISTYEEI